MAPEPRDCAGGQSAKKVMRECSKHGLQLRIERVPVWAGDGSASSPHRIDHWVTFLICPVRGCGYSRPLKNPAGDRQENRKTERVNK